MTHEIDLPQAPKLIKKTDGSTTIQIDGCYPGYGITLANALRRVLLSSLPGTAITAFKIKGVEHEFSTIPYVLEDVIKIGLNLKKVCFISQDPLFDKSAQASIKIKGEKIVKAEDIKTPIGIEVVNKDLVIANLTDKKAVFEMDLFISGGYGYERSEERGKEKLPIGTIALDAIYSPVTRVSYRIEDMRIGERTDFNRIKLDILTDGSITPEEAFKQAAKILENHFSFLGKLKPLKKTKIKTDKTTKPLKKERKIKPKKSSMPKSLSELGLDKKLIKALEDAGIKSVAGLIRKKENDIEGFKGIGKKSLSIIKRKLKKFGLSLKN